MRELSLHISDILENSRTAEADLIELEIIENPEENILKIMITDNGKGISEDKLSTITDPFVTSRTTREVGLGLSFFKKAAENANGFFKINSKEGRGSKVITEFEYDHIDRAPLGDIAATVSNFIAANGDQLDFVYHHYYQDAKFTLNSRQIKKELEDLSIQSPAVISWVREFIEENLEEIRGGEAF